MKRLQPHEIQRMFQEMGLGTDEKRERFTLLARPDPETLDEPACDTRLDNVTERLEEPQHG